MNSGDLDRKIEDKNMFTEIFLSPIFLSPTLVWGVKETNS